MSSPTDEYYVKGLDATRVAIHVFDKNGDFVKVYTLASKADCDCPGALYHRTQCKHMRMRIVWEELGRPHGFFTQPKKGDPIWHSTNTTDE